MTDSNGKPALPPYVSFRTFLNFLDRLHEGGIPQRIDRSYWGGFLAGGLGAQLMVGLRWLGLLQGDAGEPDPLLDTLSDPNQRKDALAALLRARYSNIFEAVDLMRGTTGLLDEVVRRDFKTNGDTHRKVVVFFIQAVQYAGIPVSERFTKRTRSKAGGIRRSARAVNGNGQTGSPVKDAHAPPPPNDEPARPSGNVRTVTLESGGSVTVTISVDLFDLSTADREFVLRLIDQLRGYSSQPQAPDGNLQGGDASRLGVTA